MQAAAVLDLEQRGALEGDDRFLATCHGAHRERGVDVQKARDDVVARLQFDGVAGPGGGYRAFQFTLGRPDADDLTTTEAGAEFRFGVPVDACRVAADHSQVAAGAYACQVGVYRLQQAVGPHLQLHAATDKTPLDHRLRHLVQHVVFEGDARHVVVHRDDVGAVRVVHEVVAEGGGDRHGAAFGVAPGRQFEVAAVDHGVVFDHRVLNLVVAVDGRVRHAVHDGQRTGEAMAGQALQVVVADRLPLVDDPDTARVVDTVAEEHVVLDQVAVAVAQGQGAARLDEDVAAEHVAAGLVGDDLHLAAAALEVVVFDGRQRVRQGIVATPDAQRLASVGTQVRPVAEIVVVDAVTVLAAGLGFQLDGHGHAAVHLADQVVVVEAVVAAVHGHPDIGFRALGVVVAVDHDLGNPGMVGQVVLVAPERDHLAGRREAVAEHQSGNDQVLAG